MAFKMKGFNAGKGTGSSKQFSKPAPTKQRQILHDTPRPRSIYDDRRDAGLEVSDTAMSPEQRRWEAANMQEMPESDYEGMTQDWNQEAIGASESQIKDLRRDPSQFDLDGNGRLNRKERKALKEHEERIEKRMLDPRRSDLKKDRSQSQLTSSMIERGYSQVQDPYGNWHVMNRSGKLIGSSFGYSPESKSWRNRESINPNYDPSGKVDLTISYAPTEKPVQTPVAIPAKGVDTASKTKTPSLPKPDSKVKEQKPPKKAAVKTGTSWDQAYYNRDKDVYGNMDKETYIKEAKRQKKVHEKTGKWDVKTKRKYDSDTIDAYAKKHLGVKEMPKLKDKPKKGGGKSKVKKGDGILDKLKDKGKDDKLFPFGRKGFSH